MRLSLLAYASLGIAVLMIAIAYVSNPDTGFLLTVVPMVAVLVVVPLLLKGMNKRQADKIRVQNIKKYKIRDLAKLKTGTEVRIRGVVEKVSYKWLGRPYFLINDKTGVVGVIMFAAPQEDIKSQDSIEVVGALRAFGFSKDKKLWGTKMLRLNQ